MSHLHANLTAEEPDGLAAQREVARDHLVRPRRGGVGADGVQKRAPGALTTRSDAGRTATLRESVT